MTPTETQISSHERSKRFHASIAQKAAALAHPSERLEPERAPIMEKMAELERQIQELQEVVGRQNELLGKVTKESMSDTPRFAEIVDAVCGFYGLTLVEITSARRTWNLTKPRQIACYLARKLTGLSMPQIGKRLGDRDHTTVLHAANKIQNDMKRDEILRDDLDLLELKIAEKVLNRETPRGQQVVHRLPTP